jgi:hypothetical protein
MTGENHSQPLNDSLASRPINRPPLPARADPAAQGGDPVLRLRRLLPESGWSGPMSPTRRCKKLTVTPRITDPAPCALRTAFRSRPATYLPPRPRNGSSRAQSGRPLMGCYSIKLLGVNWSRAGPRGRPLRHQQRRSCVPRGRAGTAGGGAVRRLLGRADRARRPSDGSVAMLATSSPSFLLSARTSL